MNKLKKIFLGIGLYIFIMLGGAFSFASDMGYSGLTPDNDCPYCDENDKDCCCYYNHSMDCYCEYLGLGISNCHGNCKYDDEARGFWNISKIFILICFGLYIVRTVMLWKIFKKLGEKGWYSLIPGWNIYMIYKLTGEIKWFWINLVILFCCWIFLAFIAASTSTTSTTYTVGFSFVDVIAVLLILMILFALLLITLSIVQILRKIYLISKKAEKDINFCGIFLGCPIVILVIYFIWRFICSLIFHQGPL